MNDSEPLSFGEYIRTLRLSKQLTLARAAKRLGMRSQRLCDIESGRRFQRRVPFEFISDIALKYGVSLAEVAAAAQNAIKKDRSVSELVAEIEPNMRVAEIMADKLLDLTKSYPADVERLATDVFTRVRDSRVLFTALREQVSGSDKPRLLKGV